MKTSTKTKTLIKALRILSEDIESDDGVANACVAEAADRLEEMQKKIDDLEIQLLRSAFRLRGS